MSLLLDTHEAVHEALQEFDLKEDEITAFFVDHEVNPDGAIDYAGLLVRGALASTPPDGPTIGTMMALVVGGVAVGLHLADKRAATTAATEEAAGGEWSYSMSPDGIVTREDGRIVGRIARPR